MDGTSATLLARQVGGAAPRERGHETLRRLLENPEAMAAVIDDRVLALLGDKIIETIHQQCARW